MSSTNLNHVVIFLQPKYQICRGMEKTYETPSNEAPHTFRISPGTPDDVPAPHVQYMVMKQCFVVLLVFLFQAVMKTVTLHVSCFIQVCGRDLPVYCERIHMCSHIWFITTETSHGHQVKSIQQSIHELNQRSSKADFSIFF